nr:hypothetical protein GCM10020093_049700 [Planobispora longispora]
MAQAVVVVDRDALVAYVVGDAEPARLRERLAEGVPAYMVPKAVVVLDRLPLTPNGKLDRRALPAPEAERREPADVPATETERVIAEIWSQVLGIEAVGAEEDFFDLGGHSLSATKAIARMRRELGDGVSLMDLFRNPTVRRLAALVDRPDDGDGSGRPLLHELTPPRPPGTETITYVCVPYGGASALVYRPLAEALPEGHRLLAVAVPGNDLGLEEEPLPVEELAGRCAEEIIRRVSGPLVLYGHSSVGSALTVEIARRVEAAGRDLEAVCIGAAFPFTKPRGRLMRGLSRLARASAVSSDRAYGNWLASMGVDLSDLEPEHALRIVRNMRREAERAEEYFTGVVDAAVERLRAPLITLVGDRDPATEFYEERYREWHFLTDTSVLVVIREAGHFFLKYRTAELARILTEAPSFGSAPELEAVPAGPDGEVWPSAPAAETAAAGTAARAGEIGEAGAVAQGGKPAEPAESIELAELGAAGVTWRLAGVSRRGRSVGAPGGPEESGEASQPGMRRFAAVAAGQLVSILGSALTEFAVPIWVYQTTGSVANFTLFAVLALVPGLLVTPFAGAIVDRMDRRRVMLAGDIGAAAASSCSGCCCGPGTCRCGTSTCRWSRCRCH